MFIRLASGGTIRDTGKQITYSAHDEVAREAALLFAQTKWGKALRHKGNVLFPAGRLKISLSRKLEEDGPVIE